MKKPITIFNIVAAILVILMVLMLSLSNTNVSNSREFLSISKQMENRKLTAEITGKGGYQENCLNLKLKNQTPDTLFVKLEPGRRIVCEDSSYQDIFIVKEKLIILPPLASLTTDGYGFCCRASKGSPARNVKFNIGYMAPPEWIELAEVINQNNFPTNAVQNAVWVLSDNHSIASIHYEKMEEIELLRQTVAKIKGITLPWYSITYEKDTAMLFSERPEKLYGKINYYINKNAIISINIRGPKGRLMATPVPEETMNPGNHEYKVDLNIKGWPKGEYDICVYEDYSNLNLKKRFTIE